jgi:hypothetical protein
MIKVLDKKIPSHIPGDHLQGADLNLDDRSRGVEARRQRIGLNNSLI